MPNFAPSAAWITTLLPGPCRGRAAHEFESVDRREPEEAEPLNLCSIPPSEFALALPPIIVQPAGRQPSVNSSILRLIGMVFDDLKWSLPDQAMARSTLFAEVFSISRPKQLGPNECCLRPIEGAPSLT